MIEIFKKLFTDNNIFELIDIDSSLHIDLIGFIALSKNKTRKEFYIVVEAHDLNLFIKNKENTVISISSWLKTKEFYNEDFNKNTTLLILNQGSNLIDEKNKRQILEVEENPYFFKKFVLRYSENQYSDLLRVLPLVSVESLNQLINRLDFEKFKENPTSDDYIPLLLNLFIKIPFLKVPFQEKELEDLQNSIHQKISNNTEYDNLKDIHEICLNTSEEDIFQIFDIPKSKETNEL